jgi:hypothetical protein
MLDNETLQLLRQTLAAHVGGTLTLELCHELDKIARFAPDRAVDLAQFQPAAYGAYSLRPERFSVIRGELAPLHHAHWLETEKHRHGLTLNPDYGLLLARERAGGLLQFTARDAAGAIAGHVRMYIGKSTHTSTLFAEEDTLFIRSDHRGGFLVMALMRYAEQALRQIGVREIRADSKLLNRADVLMRRLGYTAVALKFHKFFED